MIIDLTAAVHKPYLVLTKTVMIPHMCFGHSECKCCAFMDLQFACMPTSKASDAEKKSLYHAAKEAGILDFMTA